MALLVHTGMLFTVLAMMTPEKVTPPQAPEPNRLAELAKTQNFGLGRPFHVRLTPKGDQVFFLRASPADPVADLFVTQLPAGKSVRAISAKTLLGDKEEVLSVEEKAARERKRIKTSGFTGFELSEDGTRLVLKLSGKLFVYDPADQRYAQLELPEGTILTPKLSPDASQLAFVWDHNLAVVDLPKQLPTNRLLKLTPKKLTTDGSSLQPYATAEFVAQEEMSRYDGFWWSPDGQSIAYQKTDERNVEPFTITNAARPETPPTQFPYPRPGKINATVQLFVVELGSGKSKEVIWDQKQYPYLAKVIWANGPLSVLAQARDQQSQVFLRVDTTNGRTYPLFEEHDKAWLNIHDSTPVYINNGKSLLWASEESGFWELQKKDLSKDGLSIAKNEVIVEGSAGFSHLVHIDEPGNWVYFSGGSDPAQSHLFRSKLNKRSTPTQLTQGIGWNECEFATESSTLAINQSTLEELAVVNIYTLENNELRRLNTLENDAKSPERVPDVTLLSQKEVDGFRAAVIKPAQFNPKASYPVILYVYGGPGVNVVKANMSAWFMQQWMADHGFIVVSLDGRGTPRRGREFERAIREHFHDIPLDDQIRGLNALAKLVPQMDLERVGVYGWSFGGYMSALATLRRPDVFKVGVAGAPVTDWMYYDTHYTERYLGVPDGESSPAYESANLLGYADGLNRPLMLVHGVIDDNVYFTHSLQLANALFNASKEFSFVPLADATHQVVDPTQKEALYRQMVYFLGKQLWSSETKDKS